MKYFMIAGEASGDLHGSALIEAIKDRDTQADIQAWGGERMQEAGAVILKHYKELAFMGFVEVIRHLPVILGNLRTCKREIREFDPDALILIDYPGFNLRIAKWAARNGYRVFYYISPQLWAWNEKRVEIVRKSVNTMFVILPFEKAFYERHGVDVSYVGHPLLDIIERYRLTHPAAQQSHTVALLPGSRKQEVDLLLPVYLSLPKAFPEWNFVIAKAPHIDSGIYTDWLRKMPADNVRLEESGSYSVLSRATHAITTSGTATLETALFEVPQIVCYKGSSISYQIARRVIRVPYISLVNLIFEGPLVRELIQKECNPQTLREAFSALSREEESQRIKEGYAKIKSALGQGGAADNAASEIFSLLTSPS